MRKYLCAATALLLAALITGCGASRSTNSSSSGGQGSSKSYAELRWGFTTFSGPLDWSRDVGVTQAAIEQLAVQNLMEFETDGKIKPGLASSVEQPTPTTYVYHLRSGVRFSDGKLLTSADVVYSLDRNMIGKEVWLKPYWEDVASVSARGNSTVVVKLKQPSTIWPEILTFSSQIIEKAQAERLGEKALGTPNDLLIGTGPWKFDSYKPEASAELSRNPYWKGAPQPAAKITVNLFKSEAALALALRSGAVDGTFSYVTPKVFANIPGTKELTAPGVFVTFVSANTTTPPFNDVHVRRALAYATDVKGIIHALFPPGTATEDQTVVPPVLFSDLGSTQQVKATLAALPKYTFSLGAARRELARSAYPHGFNTTIEVEQVETAEVSAAQILAADLAKIGITAKVHELSPDEVPTLFTGKTKLLIGEQGTVYNDPEGVMANFLLPGQVHPPGSGTNTANYRNVEFDKLLHDESTEMLSPTKRLQTIGKLLGILGREAPYWPLYTHKYQGVISEKYVFPNYSALTSYFTPWALGVKLAH